MSTVIRTGSVYQRTKKGPNYVCIGKATIAGQTMVISVKNGNIRQDGKCKEQGDGEAVVLFAHQPKDIARLHQAREVDTATVFTQGGAVREFQHVTKRMLKNGVNTEAELPRLAELR